MKQKVSESKRGTNETKNKNVFLNTSYIIISIVHFNVTAASSQKKKNKKKAKPTAAPKTSSASLSVDSGFLCCAYQEVMVAGLAMLGMGNPLNKGKRTFVLYRHVNVVE